MPELTQQFIDRFSKDSLSNLMIYSALVSTAMAIENQLKEEILNDFDRFLNKQTNKLQKENQQ